MTRDVRSSSDQAESELIGTGRERANTCHVIFFSRVVLAVSCVLHLSYFLLASSSVGLSATSHTHTIYFNCIWLPRATWLGSYWISTPLHARVWRRWRFVRVVQERGWINLVDIAVTVNVLQLNCSPPCMLLFTGMCSQGLAWQCSQYSIYCMWTVEQSTRIRSCRRRCCCCCTFVKCTVTTLGLWSER